MGLCPIKMLAGKEDTECDREDCQWWDLVVDDCSIASAFTSLATWLELKMAEEKGEE